MKAGGREVKSLSVEDFGGGRDFFGKERFPRPNPKKKKKYKKKKN